MLQQTRVAAVIDHYARFMQRFPTVDALAASPEADVLAMWSGLGYYRRARMMHRAAQKVVAEHGGKFPGTAQALLTLPGIGAYTSAAVASIAFGEAVAVVDGNVERVLTRVAALDTTLDVDGETRIDVRIRHLAGALVDPAHPSHFNQAMMELGATICLPRRPLCLQCPVYGLCRTRGEHKATPRKALVARDAFYALVEREHPSTSTAGSEEVLLEQRPLDAPLMAGMWQLPELASAPESEKPLCRVKHSITVTNYTVRVFADIELFAHDWPKQWVAYSRVAELPLTGLARKVLKCLRTDPAGLLRQAMEPADTAARPS